MNKILVLSLGYAIKNTDGSYSASSATVLIRTLGQKILVDPGNSAVQLRRSLDNRISSLDEINTVFLTHRHADHIRNIRLFPKADVLDGDTIYYDNKKSAYSNFIPGTDIEVIPTPGHVKNHASLLVNTETGKYAIAGDTFWWDYGYEPKFEIQSLLDLPDPFAEDWPALQESRLKLLLIADYVIPGHGRLFKSPGKE